MTFTLWIDVEDLFDYASLHPRLSGVQRVELQLCHTLWRQLGEGRVRFLRHAIGRDGFRLVPYNELLPLVGRLTGDDSAASPASTVFFRDGSRRHRPRYSPVAVARRLRATRVERRLSAAGVASFLSFARRGDWIVALGSPLALPEYAGLIASLKERLGFRFVLLVHDIIPIVAPEFFEPVAVQVFGDCARDVVPLADQIVAISRSTARDLARYRGALGLPPAPIKVVSPGDGIEERREPAGPRPARLPPLGSYVLLVSTIEPRKNHALAFRVWRRLLTDVPAEKVPTLVFAGRVGWLVDDLMRQLANTQWLNGKIVLLENVTDSELLHLYDGCLFTLFPSLYEGWGLPVTESLAMGKPCLASQNTSIPEAGGSLARYFDPDSVTDAYALIRATIEDRDGLAAWRQTIASSFVPRSWSEAAKEIVELLEQAEAGARLPDEALGEPVSYPAGEGIADPR